jgi:hypothetical protein
VRINKQLHLVIPVERDEGGTLYAHSAPVSSDLFDAYWEPVGKAFSAIYSGGFGTIGGPRIAAKMLEKIAKEMGKWDGDAGVKQGLVAEAHRLTNVLVPGPKGWQTVPFDEARKTVLDRDEVSEIEGAIAFFTVAWLTHRKAEVADVMGGAAAIWGARTVSLDCTAFKDSLPTSSAGANSGATAST